MSEIIGKCFWGVSVMLMALAGLAADSENSWKGFASVGGTILYHLCAGDVWPMDVHGDVDASELSFACDGTAPWEREWKTVLTTDGSITALPKPIDEICFRKVKSASGEALQLRKVQGLMMLFK